MRETATLLGPASFAILGPRSWHARRAERVINERDFPSYIWRKVADQHPEAASEDARTLIERGLRDWFICCGWRKGRALGMPSKLVDSAWHELVLDTGEYIGFCRATFGYYLQHYPAGKPRFGSDDPTLFSSMLVNTLQAWDDSISGRGGEDSPMWSLDSHLGITEPWGLSDQDRSLLRQSKYSLSGTSIAGGLTSTTALGTMLPEGGGYGGGCGTVSGCGGGHGCGGGGGGCGGGGGH